MSASIAPHFLLSIARGGRFLPLPEGIGGAKGYNIQPLRHCVTLPLSRFTRRGRKIYTIHPHAMRGGFSPSVLRSNIGGVP